MTNKVKKQSFFEQYYTAYYSLLLTFIYDIFNIIKENINKEDVKRIKEEIH